MAASSLAVPRRHPHHDDPEEEMIMATQTLTERHADASVTTAAPIEVFDGGTTATLGTLALWLTKLLRGAR